MGPPSSARAVILAGSQAHGSCAVLAHERDTACGTEAVSKLSVVDCAPIRNWCDWAWSLSGSTAVRMYQPGAGSGNR